MYTCIYTIFIFFWYCRKAHEKVLELQHELEVARDKEVTVHSQLSRAVMCAEKATAERDTFAKIVRSCVIELTYMCKISSLFFWKLIVVFKEC